MGWPPQPLLQLGLTGEMNWPTSCPYKQRQALRQAQRCVPNE